jgi:hypothetical protein
MGHKITMTISLDSEADRDLLGWLGRQENRSAAVRGVLRAHLSGGVTLGDVYAAVRDLERRLSGMTLAGAPSEATVGDEPPEAAAALDALARL